MKKIILSIAMIASVAFISCSDDGDNNPNSCKSCANIADSGVDIEVCDNGNGKATVTTSIGGKEVSTTTVDIPAGESLQSIDCSQFSNITVETSN